MDRSGFYLLQGHLFLVLSYVGTWPVLMSIMALLCYGTGMLFMFKWKE